MNLIITTKSPFTDVAINYPADSRHQNQVVTTGEDSKVTVAVYDGAQVVTADTVVLVEIDID